MSVSAKNASGLIMTIMLFLFCCHNGYSQGISPLKFDRIMAEKIIRQKGISQNSGLCILQDSRGFMWFGTWDGLNQYDGYDFTIYNNENGLSNTTIRALLEDEQGYLWIGTEDGLNRMDRSNGNIKIFRHDDGTPNSISSNYITHILQDHERNLWISTSNGLNKYDKELNVFTLIKFFASDADSSTTNYINKTFLDRDGYLWVATRHGLHKYNMKTNNFVPYYYEEDNSNSLSGSNIQEIFQDTEGLFWFGARFGLNSYDPVKEKFTRYLHDPRKPDSLTISNNTVNALFEDPEGFIWIGTADQLNILNKSEQVFTRCKSTGRNTSLSNNDIKCIYEDMTATIWLGTYNGINKVDKNPSRFTHFHHIPSNPNSLSDNIIFSLKEDDNGLLWIATYDGVSILDLASGKFTFLKHQDGNPNSLVYNKVKVVFIDSRGDYWFGTETHGLNRYHKESGRFTLFVNDPADSTSISDNTILSLSEDRKGRLWIGSGQGVDIYDFETETFRNFRHVPGDSSTLSNNRVWTVFEDNRGFIWMGTDYGLNKMDASGHLIKCYTCNYDNPAGISGNRVFSIYEDKDSIFWIGTMGAGLNRFDPVSEEFKTFTEKDGLPSNVVYATLEDREGNLWISTNWGLSRFDKKETFVNYGIDDGVQGKEFNIGASFKNKKGTMFFGGMNGFNIFHPDDIKLNPNKPRIVITDFRVFNESRPGKLENGDTIKLSYDDNFFSFEFSALDYTNPSKNMFRFKLENYDVDWIRRDAGHRVAAYKRVNPGSYTFSVTGSNNDGVWNWEGIAIEVIITPPWWEMWAFRIPFVLLVISGFWFLIYLRFKSLRQKHQVEKRVLEVEKLIFELEQKALRLQMNPHFIFNSLNAIQSYVISNESDKAIPYLAKFSHLMRMILANSSESFIPLKDELRALRYYLDIEKLRFDDKFDFNIDIDPRIDEEFIEIPPMILQPYVENAIIHGMINSTEKGLLEICFKRKKKSLFCTIQDNGVGREKAREIRERSGIKRKSKGMMITQERMDILNKQNKKNFLVNVVDMKDDKGHPSGTRVEIVFQYREI